MWLIACTCCTSGRVPPNRYDPMPMCFILFVHDTRNLVFLVFGHVMLVLSRGWWCVCPRWGEPGGRLSGCLQLCFVTFPLPLSAPLVLAQTNAMIKPESSVQGESISFSGRMVHMPSYPALRQHMWGCAERCPAWHLHFHGRDAVFVLVWGVCAPAWRT